jgi:Protein of unknown function (DUF3987)
MLTRPPPYNGHESHFSLAGSPKANGDLQKLIANEALRVLQLEGPSAFEMPKSAAVSHEVGHVIVAMHDGVISITSVRVFQSDGAWCGVTEEDQPWRLDPATPTKTWLARARFLIAGEVGERMLDSDRYRKGTSIDEIAGSQIICKLLFRDRAAEFAGIDHPAQLFARIYNEATAIIKTNENTARKLMDQLDRYGELHGKSLQARRVNSDAHNAEMIEPVPLWAKPQAPPLPRGLLPPIIEAFAFTQSELMGADPSGLAMGALTVCATVIPETIALQVKKHDPSWRETTRMWTGLVGGPGEMKSPCLQVVGSRWRASMANCGANISPPSRSTTLCQQTNVSSGTSRK